MANAAKSVIILGARAGRHLLRRRLGELGFNSLPSPCRKWRGRGWGWGSLEKIYTTFWESDKKSEIVDDDLRVLVESA